MAGEVVSKAIVRGGSYQMGDLCLGSGGATNAAAARAYMTPLSVAGPLIIDRLLARIYENGGGGNYRMGLYREGATQYSPAGGELVVESASVAAVAGAAWKEFTVADTVLEPGTYFIAFMFQNAGNRVDRVNGAPTNYIWYYDRGGGYGAFTDPCPAVTSHALIPYAGIRIAQHLPFGGRVVAL